MVGGLSQPDELQLVTLSATSERPVMALSVSVCSRVEILRQMKAVQGNTNTTNQHYRPVWDQTSGPQPASFLSLSVSVSDRKTETIGTKLAVRRREGEGGTFPLPPDLCEMFVQCGGGGGFSASCW